MEASVKAKEAEIAEQLQAHSDKDARLASLTSRLDDSAALKALVTELRAELEARDTQIAGLLIEVEQHAAANAEKAAGIAELAATAALVPQLKASLEAQGNHMAELAGQLEQHAAAQAEKNTQIAQLAAAQAKTETPKARPSPSAGFYEVPPAATPAHQPPQNHVLEFEKRIADLRAIEAKKDEEISKLNNRLADLEKQPDPDVRRQILFSAKNAELTHFRAVLNSLFQPLNPDEVAQRAYSYAQERHFQGGSPVEDWTRAERDSHFVRLAQAWESTRPGTMF
jgi:DNA repair exonuclease SbcCD ATPase subunit